MPSLRRTPPLTTTAQLSGAEMLTSYVYFIPAGRETKERPTQEGRAGGLETTSIPAVSVHVRVAGTLLASEATKLVRGALFLPWLLHAAST